MTDVTQILRNIEQGDPEAAAQLLPVVYDELRKLASAKMAQENPGQTLQATALVHEAYLRLVNPDQPQKWENRGHFFASAAEAMRRILVENARRKKRLKRGGDLQREDLIDVPDITGETQEDLEALDRALQHLKTIDPQGERLVNLRYFAGFTNAEAAEILGVSPRTAERLWAFARVWLHREIAGMAGDSELK